MSRIDVLDNGFVRLVSYMQPAPDFSLLDNPEYGGSAEDIILDSRRGWTGDLEIVRNARVSYNAATRAGEDEGSDARLINYLYRNHHTTPFEAMVFTFEIKCPLFIARQWHRHRTWSYNEVSARYTELPEEYYVPRPEHIGKQAQHNKQMRVMTEDEQDHAIVQRQEIGRHCDNAFDLYRILLKNGVPREIARTVLPLATYTHFFATVDLHNLFHFIRLRSHEHAQWEIQQYSNALLELVEPICPAAVKAFREHV